MSEEKITEVGAEDGPPVLYEKQDNGVAIVTLNRPKYHNAQNGKMLYALDAAYRQAIDDDEVRVIVLRGNGKNFSAGHDIGSPGRDAHLPQKDRKHLWWDHSDKEGGEREERNNANGTFRVFRRHSRHGVKQIVERLANGINGLV